MSLKSKSIRAVICYFFFLVPLQPGCRLFDILMIYPEDDWESVNILCHIFEKFLLLRDDRRPSICRDVVEAQDDHPKGSIKIDFLETALKRSSSAFLFFGDGNQALDGWTKFQRVCFMKKFLF